MVIALVSNYLNHHQRILCDILKENCDGFYFIATGKMSEERAKLGYKDLDEVDYVIKAYDNPDASNRIKQIISESDAVIFGACPDSFIEYRMRQNKLSFVYSERLFKKGVWRRFFPHIIKKIITRMVRYAQSDYYVLCASAFLGWELSLCGFPIDKCFKWGYFPEVEKYTSAPVRKNEVLKLLWVGRMIPWKHAEDAIKTAAMLESKGKKFTLDIIGTGEEEENLKKLAKKLGVESKVNFLGSMPPEKVRENMRSADVFLATSDYNEGWGSVVNEAMGCGCAVVASSAMGSVPFLIEDGENGYIYKYGSQSDMDKKVLDLVEHKEKRMLFSRNALDTINNVYSAQVAAERLIEFIKTEDKASFRAKYEKGPMSGAKIIKNNWYK